MAKKTLTVIFDTSVLLSDINSSRGASRRLLVLAQERKIRGVISSTIVKEALKHAEKLRLTPEKVARNLQQAFGAILPAPTAELIDKCTPRLSDPDDAHLLATAEEIGAHYLVTLDRRHLLKEAKAIKEVTIVSPKQLIQLLS